MRRKENWREKRDAKANALLLRCNCTTDQLLKIVFKSNSSSVFVSLFYFFCILSFFYENVYKFPMMAFLPPLSLPYFSSFADLFVLCTFECPLHPPLATPLPTPTQYVQFEIVIEVMRESMEAHIDGCTAEQSSSLC